MQESPYVGGNFNNGVNAGLRYWNLNNSPGNATINIGARHILAKLRTKYRTILSIPLGKNKVVTEGFSRLILEKPLDAKEKEVITIKRIGHLYDKIVDRENIKQAIINASKNKRNRKRVQKILDNIDHYTLEIQRMLEDETYTPSPYIEEKIKDNSSGKERIIFKPKFYPDQCIHWALIQVIEPHLAKGMYEYSCGSIPKRGIHYAQKRIKRWIKRDRKHTKYILQIDITKFYPSINHDVLKMMLRKKFKDNSLLWLLDSIIDSVESGLPIGNYTSQWLANFYLQGFDHFIKQDLGVKYYVRYMDDCVLFGNNKKKLHKARREIKSHLKTIGLEIKDDWQVYRLDKRPLDFLGFRFYRTHITMRKRNALRIKRRAKKIYKKRSLNYKDSAAMLSYLGWLKHSNSYNYYLKNIKPYVNINEMKEVVRNESRKRNQAKII